MTDRNWTKYVQAILKAELKRKGVTYGALAQKLTAMGIPESEQNLNNKISRGSFTAAFFFQCMEAIGCHTLHFGDDLG